MIRLLTKLRKTGKTHSSKENNSHVLNSSEFLVLYSSYISKKYIVACKTRSCFFPDKFIQRGEETLAVLHRLVSHGKKLFLITNSPFGFVWVNTSALVNTGSVQTWTAACIYSFPSAGTKEWLTWWERTGETFLMSSSCMQTNLTSSLTASSEWFRLPQKTARRPVILWLLVNSDTLLHHTPGLVLCCNVPQCFYSHRPFRQLDSNGDLRWEKINSLDKGHIYKQVYIFRIYAFWFLWRMRKMLHSIKSAPVIHWNHMEVSQLNVMHPLSVNVLAYTCLLLIFFRETCLISSDWQVGEVQRFFILETIFIVTWL